MLDATELGSYGLKSFENVTPVVGSSMSGFPPFAAVPEDAGLQATARTTATVPTIAVNALPFIRCVTSLSHRPQVDGALLLDTGVSLPSLTSPVGAGRAVRPPAVRLARRG